MNRLQLQGKACVVTGAAFGIGRATAVRFAQEGAQLVVTDIQDAPLLSLAEELRAGGDLLPGLRRRILHHWRRAAG